MTIHAFRLHPGNDLKKEIQKYVVENNFTAGVIISCVGSLETVSIRMANKKQATVLNARHEIISLSGTLSVEGSHLHISLAGESGEMLGGHLLDGCKVFTTAEIVLGRLPQLSFRREDDQATGFKELVVDEKK